MPRFRNIFDFSTEDQYHLPKESILDVLHNDSVKTITIYFLEDNDFVQVQRLPNSKDWQVITSFEVVKQKKINDR